MKTLVILLAGMVHILEAGGLAGCRLSRDYAARGERARPGRSGWRPRQAPFGPPEGSRRSVTLQAWKPTGEGAGWQRPGRACSPSHNAWIRLRPFGPCKRAGCPRSGLLAGAGRGTFVLGLVGLVLALSCCLGAAADVFDAVRAGDVEKVQALLQADPKVVEARTGDGNTPLHVAALEGHTAAAQALLDGHAQVNARGLREETPLHIAARLST